MTEEEYFRKNYPNSCYGDKPLSPYWDFFQDGVEFGEQQSEKKIEELEETIANLKEQVQSQVEATIELDKENAELKEELANWKDEWQEQVQKAIDEGYARTLQTIQLNKAKDLLAKWVELFKPKSDTALPTPIQVDTEQFLNSEVGKCQSQKQHLKK